MTTKRYLTAGALLGCLALAAQGVRANSVSFNIVANGIKEVSAAGVPNGDPDATGIGTLTLDNGTGAGNTGSATFNLQIRNIDGTLNAHHIHQGPPTTTGGVVIDFGNPNTILIGTATSGTLSGTITGLPATTINNVFANPTAFYYNLHSNPNYPSGAVRDQLPEPGSAVLAGLGALGLLARRRSRGA